MKYILLIGLTGLLTACAPNPGRDYESSAACHGRGLEAGTEAFEECVEKERNYRLMQQQRKEFEEYKDNQREWRERRAYY